MYEFVGVVIVVVAVGVFIWARLNLLQYQHIMLYEMNAYGGMVALIQPCHR